MDNPRDGRRRLRDYTAMEMVTPCGILLAIGVGGFVIGSAIYSRRN